MSAGRKDDDGKLPLELLPPGALCEIAAVLAHGREKYGAWNWAAGMAAGRLVGAALRHILAWWSGENDDPESGLSHLAHAGCCILFLLELRGTRPDGWRDDRPVAHVRRLLCAGVATGEPR